MPTNLQALMMQKNISTKLFTQTIHIRARAMLRLSHIPTSILHIIGAEYTLFKRICAPCLFSFALWINTPISNILTLNRMFTKHSKNIIPMFLPSLSKRLQTASLSRSALCMLSRTAISRMPKALSVSAFTVSRLISVCSAKLSITLGCPMSSATAGFCRRF